MLALDRDALLCDFAETYHVFSIESLPVKTAAALANGLRSNSRIRMKAAGDKIDLNSLIMAHILDGINTLIWFQTKDGAKGKNRPKSVVEMLTRDEIKETAGFVSGKEFERMREELLERIGR